MQLFLLIAAVCFVFASIVILVPTTILGVPGLGWIALGLLAWVLDALVGGVSLAGRQ